MSDVPQIFDEALRARRRRRMQGAFEPFLAEAAAGELKSRLEAVRRKFARALWYGPCAPAVEDISWTIADIVETSSGSAVFEETRPPFAEGALDLYVSLMNLHAVNDLPGALHRIRTTLEPGGLFMAALFGGETLHELRTALAEAEIEIAGGLSPRVSPFADVRDLGGLLQRAGFALPVADVDRTVVRYVEPLKLLHDLRRMGETSVLMDRRRKFLARRVLFRALELYRSRFAGDDGRVPATFEIVYLAGWAPHPSQPQPLKPGSATRRLEDALREISEERARLNPPSK